MRGHVRPQRRATPERLPALPARELALPRVRHLRRIFISYILLLSLIFRFIQIDKSTGSPYHVRREVVAVGEVSVAEVAGVHHLPVGRAGHPPDGQAVGKVLLLVRFQT